MSAVTEDGDWTHGITIAVVFTAMDPSPRDELLAADIGHQWFCFCLDAVARAEG
jgi:hypothetical protein